MYIKKLFLILLLVPLFSFSVSVYGVIIAYDDYDTELHDGITYKRLATVTSGKPRNPNYGNLIPTYVQKFAWDQYGNFGAYGALEHVGNFNPGTRDIYRDWDNQHYVYSLVVLELTYSLYGGLYLQGVDTDNLLSVPYGKKIVSENHYIQNPFDYSIWIRTFYDGNTVDTTEIPAGGSHDFDLFSLGDSGDPNHFDYQISSNGSNYNPVSPVDWYGLTQELSKMFGQNVWGDGITTNIPVDFPSAVSVTNATTDLIYDFQKALQNQNLSGEDIQQAFENSLVNNSMTKEGITYAMIDGIVFSGLPAELRAIDATGQGVITAIDGIEFDTSDVVSAINNIDYSVDSDGIITAIEEQELSITNNIYFSSTNNIIVTNDFNFAITNNIIVTNDFNFNITNNIILTNIVDLFTGDPLEGAVTNTMNFSEDYSADSELTTEFNSDITDYLNVKSNVFNSIFTGSGIDINDLNPFECDVEFPLNKLIDISVNLFDYDLHFVFDLDMIPFIDLIRKLELLALTILVFFKAVKLLGWAFE